MSDHWTPGHDGMPRPMPATTAEMTTSQRDRVVTPDGVPLAGWWRRLIAYWVDGILVAIGVQAVLLPLQLTSPDSWLTPVSGRDTFTEFGVVGSVTWWYAIASIVATIIVGAAYTIGMHARLGWTLGKRLLRIRVRHRLAERLPTLGEASIRWAVQWLPVALQPMPWLGGAAGLWTTIDGLWALWDERRQALHDKACGTSVVMAWP